MAKSIKDKILSSQVPIQPKPTYTFIKNKDVSQKEDKKKRMCC